MGTISEKLTYLNTTKEKLKDSINNIGGSITNETTFRAYAEELDNIYSNIPKTTGEGSNLSLSTIKGRINVDDILGDTKQDTTTGINLFNISAFTTATTIQGVTFTPTGNGGIKMSGTSTNTGQLDITFSYTASGNYTMATIVEGTFTASPQVLCQDSNGNVMYNNAMSSNTTKINTFNNVSATIIRARIYFTSGITFNCTLYTMLLSGTYTSSNLPSFEPYTNGASPNPTYPQDIEVVTGQQEVVVANKKIFDNYTIPETYQRVDYIQSSGTQYVDTGIAWNNASKIVATLGSQATNNLNVFFSSPNNDQIWIGYSSSNTMTGSGFSSITITPQVSFSDFTDGTLREITFDISSTKTSNISFGFYLNSSFQKINRIRNLKVYNSSNTLVRNMIACYRKSDNVLGMYDLIGNVFYTNEGSGNFTKGDNLQSQTKTLHLGDIELSKIGTYQDRIFETSGKQLFDSLIELGSYDNTTGLPANNGSAVRTKTPVEVKPNTTYTLSNNLDYHPFIYEYGESDNFIQYTRYDVTTATFTTSATTKYIRVRTNATNVENKTSVLFMLNEGSTALPYEPYGSDKWYIENNYEKVTLANYTWLQNTTSTTGKNRYYTNGLTSVIEKTATNGTKTTKGLLCNILTESTPNNNYLCTNNTICSTPNGQTYIYVESISGETGTTALMNLLTSTNAYALIPLATTTYEEITNESLINELNEIEKMMSYNGQTNISISGNLPMILNVSALKGE